MRVRSKNINEIKKEDKSAFNKFILILLIGMLVGALIGVLSAILGESIADVSEKWLQNMLVFIAPFANLILIPVTFLPALYLYQSSRRRYREWGGENEAQLEKIELNISYALWITNLAMILSMFFFAVGLWLTTNAEYSVSGNFLALWIGGFILINIFITLTQQKVVNFTKEINPEKEGSVFDLNFAKKWENSCDEAEKLKIYKSSYKAYRSVNITCIILWMVCMLGSSIWGFGLLPVTFVSIIWIVQTTSYCLECIRLEKVRKDQII